MIVLLFLMWAFTTTCRALSLSPCGTDNTLEVIENKGDNLFTCSGLTSSDDALWRLLAPGGDPSEYDLGTCSSSCNNDIPDAFRLGRPTVGQSTLTVNSTNTVYNFFLQGTSIVCTTSTQTNQQGASCQVDLVAVPATKSCNVRYNTGTSASWTVTANCSFTGVYSHRNRSKCRLVQTSPTQQNVGSEVTYTPTGSNKYKSGSCEVTAPFPSTTNSYSYQMVIVPGRVEVTANFEGGSSSFQISRPSSAPSHTCSEYVEERSSVTCTCSSTNLGQPTGVVKWSSSGTTQLSFSNVNRNQDGSQHVCEVVWNGQRVQSVTYTLRVVYSAFISSFTASSTKTSVTVGVNDSVTLTCRAEGRPSPRMTLSRPNGVSINSVGQGTPSLSDEPREVTGKVTAQCPDTGLYTCDIDNGVGMSQQRQVSIFVQCGPEKAAGGSPGSGEDTIPAVNFRTGAERFTVDVIAYPTPRLTSIKRFSQRPNAASVGQPASQNTVAVTCLPARVMSSSVTCYVTVDNMTSSDAGFYQAVIGNGFGDLTITFQVKVNAENVPTDSDKSFSTGAAVGVTVAVFVVLIIAGIIWMWRRQWILPCAAAAAAERAHGKGTQDERATEQNRAVEAHQLHSDEYELHDDGSPRNAQDTQPASAYSSLQTNDIGVPSIYSPLSPYRNVGAAAHQGPVYDNSQPASGPVYVSIQDTA